MNNYVEMNTMGLDMVHGYFGLMYGSINMYSKPVTLVELDTFDLEVKLQVLAVGTPGDCGRGSFIYPVRDVTPNCTGHNVVDAAITLMLGSGDRNSMLYFIAGEIGWGDSLHVTPPAGQTSTFATNTSVMRTYRWSRGGGLDKVYVDGVLALSRTTSLDGWNGTVSFGDQTNDLGEEGHFRIQSIALVPKL